MNLTKLFETQKALDERIVKEKGLEGRDLLPEKILALQVELGELANEWRGFKFWSNNQEPNVLESKCIYCHTLYVGKVEYCEGCYEEYEKYFPVTVNNPLLEEYVDCLHFILSIGLEEKADKTDYKKVQEEMLKVGIDFKEESITRQFSLVFYFISEYDNLGSFDEYANIVVAFTNLGSMLGFTWKQIEQAYYDKNKINHERQDSNY